MAYSFNGTSQYLVSTTAAVTSFPVTLSCWFYANSATVNNALVTVSDMTTPGICMINASGAVSGKPLRAAVSSPISAGVVADSTQSYPVGSWSHAAGVFTSTQASAWLNGQKTTATPSGTNLFPSVTRTTIGARLNSGVGVAYVNGSVGEVGIWNVDLSDDEVRSLSKGVSPRLIRPQSLVFYAPLVRNLVDVRGGLAITNTNSATVAAHPRIYA